MRDGVGGELEVRILGPLEVWVDGRRVELGGGRQRALLALLALNRNRVVSSDRLVDEFWGDGAPPTAAKIVQNLVVQLRKALGDHGRALATQSPGYVLRLPEDAIDAGRFERLAADGRRLLEDEPRSAAERFREALALWRGEALADFAYEGFARGEIERLEELRLGALEGRFDADLATGRGTDLVPELETLVAAHPLRERLREQLMLALYRSGRQSEALDAYREGRTFLHEGLGLEPGAGLRELERAILEQDPSLGVPPQVARPLARRQRFAVVGLVATLVAGAAVATAVVVTRASGAPSVVPNSVVRIDADTNEIVDVVGVGRDPGQLAVAGDYLFVAGQEDGTLTRVHLSSGEIETSGRYDLTGSVASAGGQSLWAVGVGRDEVVALDSVTLERIEGVSLPRSSNLLQAWVEVGADSLWVAEWFPPAVARWRLRTLELERRYRLPDAEYPLEVAFGRGAAWVALWTTNRLLRIDEARGRASYVRVGNGPRDPALGFGSVWVAMGEDGTVWRLHPRSRKVEAVMDVGGHPWGLAVGAGGVWVSNNCDGTVSRIDPDANAVEAVVETGFFPQWVAAVGRDVWVGLAETWSPVPGSGPSTLEGCN